MLSSEWQLIEQSWHWYGKNLKSCAPFLAVIGALTALADILQLIFMPNRAALDAMTNNQLISFAMVATMLGLLLFFTTFYFLRFLHALITNQKKTHIELAQLTLRVFVRTLIVVMATAIAVRIGVILYVIPGLILFVFMAFAEYYALFEHATIIESFKKSWNLVRDRWSAVACRLYIPAILVTSLMFVINFIVQYLVVQTVLPGLHVTNVLTLNIISIILNALALIVFFPWITLPSVFLFSELKKTPLL